MPTLAVARRSLREFVAVAGGAGGLDAVFGMVVAHADVEQVAAAAQVVRGGDRVRDARAVQRGVALDSDVFLAVADSTCSVSRAEVDRVLPGEFVLARVDLADAAGGAALRSCPTCRRERAACTLLRQFGSDAVVQEDGVAVDFLECCARRKPELPLSYCASQRGSAGIARRSRGPAASCIATRPLTLLRV